MQMRVQLRILLQASAHASPSALRVARQPPPPDPKTAPSAWHRVPCAQLDEARVPCRALCWRRLQASHLPLSDLGQLKQRRASDELLIAVSARATVLPSALTRCAHSSLSLSLSLHPLSPDVFFAHTTHTLPGCLAWHSGLPPASVCPGRALCATTTAGNARTRICTRLHAASSWGSP